MLQALFSWVLFNTLLSCNFWFLVIGYYTVKFAVAFGLGYIRAQKFPAMVKKRLEECDQSFAYDVKIDDIPQAMRDRILQVDLIGLRQLIWSQTVSAEQVLKFYFYRSKTIGRELNAAIEANFEEALKLAKEADLKIKTTPESERPPLLGLPFSVKENFFMKGFEMTEGMEPRLGKKQDKTAPLITHLIKQGGIPFVISNTPQALMTTESVNFIYGACANPHDRTRTSGGSSGGEGALVGGGCSPAGLGNDIGGSVRIPAAFSGVFGFKPTTGRLNVADHLDCVHPDHGVGHHQGYIRCSNGPLGRSVNDIAMLTEEFCAPEINYLSDRSLPPLPWRKEAAQLKEGTKLTIGYFESIDEVFECHKAGQRAVREVVEALKKQGHTLVKIDVMYQKEIFDITNRIFMTDGMVPPLFSFASGMRLIKAYQKFRIGYMIPHCIKQLIGKVLTMMGKERKALVLTSSSPMPAKDIFHLTNFQLFITSEFYKSLQQKGIQHLISPGFGVPALKHGTSGDLWPALIYTCMYNFFGMPAGTLPVTRVQKSEQTYESKHDDEHTQVAKDCMAGSEGLPVAVQVVAMPYQDEECIALMRHVEEIMHLKPILKV
jgi:fatty acid amide hydrolase